MLNKETRKRNRRNILKKRGKNDEKAIQGVKPIDST